ncbi:MAG: calcium-binding protein, partial [Pseudomonadota bacterium]
QVGTEGDDVISTTSDNLDVVVEGLGGNDTITTGTGDDEIHGGAGDDSLTAGAGNDIFVFVPGLGNDTVTDFSEGSAIGDVIDVSALPYSNLAEILADTTQVGADSVIDIDDENSITLRNVDKIALHQNDFIFS